MTIWEYNAYYEGYKLRQADNLSLQIQAAYYGAYWGSFSKGHKKSLQSVIKGIYKNSTRKKAKKSSPIDFEKVERDFKRMEDIKEHGWSKN